MPNPPPKKDYPKTTCQNGGRHAHVVNVGEGGEEEEGTIRYCMDMAKTTEGTVEAWGRT